MAISYVTIGAGVVLLVCLIIGLKRGMLRSLLSLISVAGSIVATIFLAPLLAPSFQDLSFVTKIKGYGFNLAPIMASLIVFLGVFIITSIIFHFIIKAFDSIEILKSIDRILGMIFHLVSGFAFIIIVCYIINMFNISSIIENAKTDAFGNWLISNNIIDQLLQKLGENNSKIKDFIDSIPSLVPKAKAVIFG